MLLIPIISMFVQEHEINGPIPSDFSSAKGKRTIFFYPGFFVGFNRSIYSFHLSKNALWSQRSGFAISNPIRGGIHDH